MSKPLSTHSVFYTIPSVKICPPSSHQFPHLPSPPTTTPALQGWGCISGKFFSESQIPGIALHIKLHYRFSGAYFPSFQNSNVAPGVPHAHRLSGCQRESRASCAFQHSKTSRFSPKVSLPIQDQRLSGTGCRSTKTTPDWHRVSRAAGKGTLWWGCIGKRMDAAHLCMGFCLYLDLTTPYKYDFLHRCFFFYRSMSQTYKIPTDLFLL